MDKLQQQERDAPPISWKSFLFSTCVIALCILSIIPIQIDVDSTTAKVFTTILGMFPILLSTYRIFILYIEPVFSRNPTDPQTLSMLSFILNVIAWLFSFALVYLILWVWERGYFLDVLVSGTDDAYEAYRFMIAGSVGAYVSDSPTFLDSNRSWITILVASQSIISIILNLCVVASIITFTIEKVKPHHRSSRRRTLFSEEPTGRMSLRTDL